MMVGNDSDNRRKTGESSEKVNKATDDGFTDNALMCW